MKLITAIVKCILIFCITTTICIAQRADIFTFHGVLDRTKDLFSNTKDLVSSTVTWLSSNIGLSENCPFSEDITESLPKILPLHIRGQDASLEIIYNAMASWEFQRRTGMTEPLVLALTGPTGVGKSETCFQIANAILKRRTRVGQSRRFLPNGLLVLRGEDYSPLSETSQKEMGEIHRNIRSKLVQHISRCGGNAVVLFDEIQKVAPGTLDALLPGLTERGTLSTEGPDGRLREVSTANCIFLLVSDIGADRMTRLLLSYGERQQIPVTVLRAEVKAALDEQWARLQFGKVVTEVVPFLPLEEQSIREVLAMKLHAMSVESSGLYWTDLVVDDAAVALLAGPRFVRYQNHSAMVRPSQCAKDSCPAAARYRLFSTYGGRALENAGPLQDLRSMLFRMAQPWRPSQLLHVGLTSGDQQRDQPLAWRWGVPQIDGQQLFFQWCDPSVAGPASQFGGVSRYLQLTPEAAASERCDTTWFGKFPQ